MIKGHGDDLYKYETVRSNFSSNIFNHFDHSRLFEHLSAKLRLTTNYPEPEPYSLEQDIANELRVDATNVVATNGATEAIYLIAQRYRGGLSYILQPTFSEYSDACRINSHETRCIFSLDECPDESDNSNGCNRFSRMIWICNPNNPTGTVKDKAELMAKIAANPLTIFIIDESYAAYTCKELPLVSETVSLPNVIVLRSMTKDYGIPGLRLGYAVGCEKLINGIRSVRMPWSVNAIAIEAGRFLLRNKASYAIDALSLCEEREHVARELQELGMTTFPSDTNILLCKLRKGNASDLKEYLATVHGILIRDASNFEGLTDKHFRIAVQTHEENVNLINAIKEWNTL